jgi:signal transduction histidine kinase
MSAAVSLTLGVIHLLVWFQDRRAWANLWFAAMAVSVAAFAGVDLAMMRAETAAQFAALHVWVHVPLFVAIACMLGFILFYFHSGRVWLAWTVIGLRVAVLVIDFTIEPTLNYRAITGLLPLQFLGETVSVPVAVQSPWSRLGEGSVLLLLIFVVDASISLWRRGNPNERRRAFVVGSSIVLFISITVVNAYRVHTGAVHGPYFVSLFFVLIVVAMGYELSRDVIRAARMAEELQENAESMGLATAAAQLALWRWDIPRDLLWVSPHGRHLYGIENKDVFSFRRFLDTLHPDDRDATQRAVTQSIEGDGIFGAEYRVVLPDASVRWIGALGKVEFDGNHKALCMRGVSGDITGRKAAELEAAQHRAELAHLTRVTTLSELSGSLAHELNQPLAIILSNAQAAQRLIAQSPPDVGEVRDILSDIVSEDQRAGEVIQRLRALLKRGETVLLPLSLDDVITEVLRLTSADLIGRGVTVRHEPAPDLPQISGDRVQLQQVVLNLIINGSDAMSANAPGTRRLRVVTARQEGMVRVSLRDEGCGLPVDVDKLFKPFFTTKPHGLGMGLAICRSIISAHQGRLWAEPHPERGAIFHLELPAL